MGGRGENLLLGRAQSSEPRPKGLVHRRQGRENCHRSASGCRGSCMCSQEVLQACPCPTQLLSTHREAKEGSSGGR